MNYQTYLGVRMDNYSFLADLMTSFRASSDFVKIVWLLSPMACIFSLIYGMQKLRRPWRPHTGGTTYSIDMPQIGSIDVHHDGPLYEVLNDIHKYGEQLSLAKERAKERAEETAKITTESQN